MHPPRITAVLGFCPPHYRPDYLFVFISASAFFFEGQWQRVGNGPSMFPPDGTIFVPRDCFPAVFQPGYPGAWAIVDQPNWQQQHLGARFRAARQVACPPEFVQVPCRSDCYEWARQVLLHEGLHHPAELEERDTLLEFTDGIAAGPLLLTARPGTPRRFLCTEQVLRRPLPAWQVADLQRLTLSFENVQRVFASQEAQPVSGGYVDFASLEAMLEMAQLGGGTGHQATTKIDVEELAHALRQIINSFLTGPSWQVRRARLQRLLDQALEADGSRLQWEGYLRDHPAFTEAARRAADELRKELRKEAHAELQVQERGLVDQIQKLQAKQQEEDEFLQAIRQELAPLQQQRDSLLQEIAQFQAERERQGRADTGSDIAPTPTAVLALPTPAEGARPAPLHWEIIEEHQPRSLVTAAEAIDHLEENFKRLGLLSGGARALAREVFCGANLGQALLFRGSFALPLAEVVATSFAGSRWGRLAISTGLTRPVSMPVADPGPPFFALILDGVNRSCFDAYGGALSSLLQGRALGLRGRRPPVPLLLGTLLDGPSCLPPTPSLLALGPIFHTDYLPWRASLAAATPEPGDCASTVWDMQPAIFPTSDFLNGLPAILNIHWERNLASAGALLASLPEGVPPGTSLLFAWIVPFLIASGVALTDLPETLRDHWREHARDARLGQFLRAHGLEFDQ